MPDWFNIAFYAEDIELCNKFYDGRSLLDYVCPNNMLPWVLSVADLDQNRQNYYLLKTANMLDIESVKVLLNRFAFSQDILVKIITLCPVVTGKLILPLIEQTPPNLTFKYDLADNLTEFNLPSVRKAVKYGAFNCLKKLLEHVNPNKKMLLDMINVTNFSLLELLLPDEIDSADAYRLAKLAINAKDEKMLSILVKFVTNKKYDKLHIEACFVGMGHLFGDIRYSLAVKLIKNPQLSTTTLESLVTLPQWDDDPDILIRALQNNIEDKNQNNVIVLAPHVKLTTEKHQMICRYLAISGQVELLKVFEQPVSGDFWYDILDEAIEHDLTPYVKYLHDTNKLDMDNEINTNLILYALSNEHINIIRYYASIGFADKIKECYDMEPQEHSLKFSAMLAIILA